MKILVAEDDAVTRLMLQRTLQKFGYDVVVAENGRKASEILKDKEGPRLAIVDWMMPLLDGPGLCRELRCSQSGNSYTYIILLTSKQESEDIVEGLEAGADEYITKPFQPAELRARLRTGKRILSLEQSLIEAREEMRFGATHDALTTLWNRSAILSLARSEISRSAREKKACSFLLCDIDHFKRVNDTHGHLVGDVVLKEVAARLGTCVRAYDGVGRYGGEEFLIVLGACDADGLATRSEEIRAKVAKDPIVANGAEVSVTVSIGAYACPAPTHATSLEDLLAQADAALYEAKASGRNRVVTRRV